MSDLNAYATSLRLSVAPMMDWTDRHCRVFHRLLAPHARLYTEMVHAQAVRLGDRERLLGFSPPEHPVALQLGGSEPAVLAEAARIGEQWGYDEINLNVGCPSDRVQAGRFGACLMREPDLVADCVAAMGDGVQVPVTVKCRIGVDDQDEESTLGRFIERVAAAGCTTFIVHARKAWLQGLSPKENREIPPLRYDLVHRLKARRPHLQIVINGGLSSLLTCLAETEQVDGVMLGRAAYHDPFLLHQLYRALFEPQRDLLSRHELLRHLQPYAESQLASGVALKHLTRHLLGLFAGQQGGRQYRQILSEQAPRVGSDWSVVENALNAVEVLQGKAA